MASILPSSLRVIPSDITCESYEAVYNGLAQSLGALPLDLSQGVRSSKQSLQDAFPRCSVPASFVAAYLTSSNLVTLLNCTLKSQNIYPVEVWKLFFLKEPAVLDQALETFANMASNNTYPTSSNVLEALGEVTIANFSQAQLQSEEFITSWFKTKIRPFLAAPSFNFLFCLSSKNFSCQTYQIVIQAFGSQKASMDRDRQQAVFTHFIKPFLSRNDSTDPGCVSSITGSQEWLKKNLGEFVDFASLQDLQAFNPNLSTAGLLSVLSPSEVAQLLLSSGALNNTDLIDLVFERLDKGNALENVDVFLTQLTINGQTPTFEPVVRDHVMNKTFTIISPHFSSFTTNDFDKCVSGMAKVFKEMPPHRQQQNTVVLLGYLKRSDSLIHEPACRKQNESDSEWVRANLGPFVQYTAISDLKDFNISTVAVLDLLSPLQKAYLILGPNSSVLNNKDVVRKVLTSLTETSDYEQLKQFFEAFANINMQRNITLIQNPDVRDTILNLTLTALAPQLKDFQPEDYQLWFQVYLVPVMASILPSSLRVIPSDITCESYEAVYNGLAQSLGALPLDLSQGVRSSKQSLQDAFPRCSVPASFVCKVTPVHVNLICDAADGSKPKQILSAGNSSAALCNYTITEHACSSAAYLTSSNLVTLLNCTLKSQNIYPVEVWKLFFLKEPAVLDQALETFANMASNNTYPTSSNVLEALGEVTIANFSQAQLQSEEFITSWFKTKIRPFLAAPSFNFLFCLSSKNFSCQTYQIVIQAFGSQKASMDRDRQQAVFTHFIKPFLSRNDSTDPGCVSSITGSQEWLKKNLGEFVDFASLQDLQAFNPNLSTAGLLSALSPSEVAQLLLSSGALNNTDLIDLVFERLDKGNALENVDVFLTQLTINGQTPTFEPVVRDHVMNKTFTIISPHFSSFTTNDFDKWFSVKLVPILASFTPEMLTNATTNINCTIYHIIVSGMAKVFKEMPPHRQQQNTVVLLGYLKRSDSLIHEPACRKQNESDSEWLRANLGPFVQYTAISDLKDFNISTAGLLSALSPSEVAQFLLSSGALNNTDLIDLVFERLDKGNALENVDVFLTQLTINGQTPTFEPVVRDHVMNKTFTIISPHFSSFTTNDFDKWFSVKLVPILASFTPEMLTNATTNINCTIYHIIVSGMAKVFKEMPPHRQQQNTVVLLGYLKRSDSLIHEPACRKQNESDSEWLRANLGPFVQYTAISDLKDFNISTAGLLSVLSPSEVAQLLLSSGALNNTDLIDLVFERLDKGNALENVDVFLTQLTINGQTPTFEPVVRDHVMNQTFTIISPHFSSFTTNDFDKWFSVKLVPILASFTPEMLTNATTNINCTIYHIIVSGMAKVFKEMPPHRQQQNTVVLLGYLKRSDSLIHEPACRKQNESDSEWVRANLGPFVQYTAISDLKDFNISTAGLLSALSPSEVAQLLLSSGALNNTDLIDLVFERLDKGNALENVDVFLTQLTINGQTPTFEPVVRDHVMNKTFTIISPHFSSFTTNDFDKWFSVKLVPILASFTPEMLTNATTNINCTIYHIIVSGMAKVFKEMPPHRQQQNTVVLLGYLKRSDSIIHEPACRKQNESDSEWVRANLGPFVQYTAISDLKDFNISTAGLLSALSPSEVAQLLLSSGALNNTDLIDLVFERLDKGNALENVDVFLTQLTINGQTPTFEPVVRDHVMNQTFTIISPHFSSFTTNDFDKWFSVKLVPILASFTPEMLTNATTNINCTIYHIIVSGMAKVFKEMPPHRQQQNTVVLLGYLKRSDSIIHEPACRKQNESDFEWLRANLGPFVQYTAISDLKDFNISTAGLLSALSPSEVAQLLLSSGALNNTDLIDLVFERLDKGNALENVDVFLTQLTINGQTPTFEPVVRDHVMNKTFTIISPHFSSFTTNDFDKWFSVKLVPILASFTPEMLTNATTNINCTIYHIIVSGMAKVFKEMPPHRQQQNTVVLLGYLKRSDSLIHEPACRKQNDSDSEWLRANLGPFVQYTAISDLKDFNISRAGLLSALSPSEVAQFLLSSGALNNTDLIDLVFERLDKGNALENVDVFLTQLTINGQTPTFEPVVRDHVMNKTFTIISPHFSSFTTNDFDKWFSVKLVPILASFTPEMLTNATTNINCTIYHIIVSGMAKVFKEMPPHRQQQNTVVLLGYLKRSDSLIHEPACRKQNESDSEWVRANLGPFVQYTAISDLKDFNISTAGLLSALSPSEVAQLLLSSGALNNTDLIDLVFERLDKGNALENVDVFLTQLTINGQTPTFEPVVRDHVMNKTFTIISPHFSSFTTNDFDKWFSVKLVPILASFTPEMLTNATTNINCTIYHIIVSGMAKVFKEMPPHRQQQNTVVLLGYLKRSDSLIHEPACRKQNESDSEWLRANLGPFVQYTAISDLKDFNISTAGLLSALSPSEVAQLLLSSGALNNTDLIDLVFERLDKGNALENVDVFLTQLTINGQTPTFEPVVRDHVMNKTFTIISPHFSSFTTNDFDKWFSVKLVPILASFTPEMLTNATTNINCTIYHIIVSGMAKVFKEMPPHRQQQNTVVLLGYLKRSDSLIHEPACRKQNESDSEWLRANLGPFVQYTAISDLKDFNISTVAVLDLLSPLQKAYLILGPNSSVLNDKDVVRKVLTSLTETSDYEQLKQFFEAFANINMQRNITLIQNPDVRDTILNLTLTALAPQLKDFQPEDYQLWFQVYLVPVMASILPSSLRVIPSDITCESYEAVYNGLAQSLGALPLDLSQGVRSSKQSLQDAFPRCSVPASFVCKVTPVHVNLICDAADGSKPKQILSAGNSSAALCNYTITEHACSSAAYLTSSNLVTLLNCTLKSQNIYPVEVWKLFFLKEPAVLDQALETFANMASNNTYPTSSNVLEALGEVTIANFSQAQLQSEEFITSWFKTKIRPFLAAPSFNFLFCLSSKNFSCQTYQIVIQAFGSQKASMDRDRQQAVFTHFIKPFLSRNDSTDPGCVSSITGSQEWLKKNLGEFVDFASLQDLQAFNPNLSTAGLLSVLSPSEVAQLLLSSGALNNTDLIDLVFERLDKGNALENVDVFLTQLTINGQTPTFEPVVRDHVMNKTFTIISPHFSSFTTNDFDKWFSVKLVPILASFTPEMLTNATTNINCTIYHIIVSGVAKVFKEMPPHRQQQNTVVLLGYLKRSDSLIHEPACRKQNESDSEWVRANLGPFVQYTAISDLKDFNISTAGLLSALSPSEVAQLLLSSGALNNTDLIDLVFERLDKGNALENVDVFLTQLTINGQTPTFEPVVRDHVMNKTFTIISPHFSSFTTNDFDKWFSVKLVPILASFTPEMLTNATTNINCTIYHIIVSGMAKVFKEMPPHRQQQNTVVLLGYLKRSDSLIHEPACRKQNESDSEWVRANLGPFVQYTGNGDLKDFNISMVNLADLLTLSQLATLAATPLQLKSKEDVMKIMAVINPGDFGAFFDHVSPAIKVHSANYSQEVKSAFLEAVFNRGNLSSPAVSDGDFLLWLRVRLSPLLTNLSPSLVTPLFSIGIKRSCNSSQEMITLLDTLNTTLSSNTQREIYKNILVFLQGPPPLKCYSGGSFYVYLRNTFLSFGFLDSSTFVSLLPPMRKSELLDTISTSELRQFLSQPNVIGNSTDICVIFNNYNNTPSFLETEDVPDNVKKVILPCIWPFALNSRSRAEANLWFDLRLRNYLRFLSKSLISPDEVQNASCFAFQKLVYVMGNNFTYNSSEFGQQYVYTTIKTYLSAGSGARCYNASDAALNSTAWFVSNIGNFVTFITLDDLTTFVSTAQFQVFLKNQANLELFNNKAIPANVTNYYVTQLFAFDPNFKPVNLPGFFLCSSAVPPLAYTTMTEAETMVILNNLKTFCNGRQDPEVSAALASNIKIITSETFIVLGSSSAGLSNSQISSVSSSVLISSLSTLGSISIWSQDQASIIIQTITASGFQINSEASLASLGTLVIGLPSETIAKTSASVLLSVSNSTTFVSNMLAAPSVVQLTFVKKIISLDINPSQVVLNVPDAMAVEIPPSLLVFSSQSADITVLNRKTWTPDQAAIFFGVLDNTNFDIEQLSPSVLQGFTCTSVQKMTQFRTKELIRACRRRAGRAKVQLKESQLTCMLNLLSGEISQNFTDYPSDMLLYLSSKNVNKGNCRSYFSALGAADFSVASKILNKGSQLFREATACLGINGLRLSRQNVEILGNMACTLDGSYIQNADPLILEKLKACNDFSASQVAAMETLLLSGTTQYGNAASWNEQTLENLVPLPLYFTRNIWSRFDFTTKKMFLKTFMPKLRKANTEKSKLKTLFQKISSLTTKREAGCTTGNITQVIVSDPSFPFGYDLTQFDLCLDVPVLKENLNSICNKVDDNGFQTVILKKLNEAFPSGVPDQDVQVLGSVSRVASFDDISKWNITKIDTLAALMKPEDGPWEAAKSNKIITQYLSTFGNSLGSTELTIIDSNLCSLNTSTLQTISPDSIRNASSLNVSACSAEQKKVLYDISKTSFSSQRSSFSIIYQLIKPYLGGAPLQDIVALSTQNISMDISTFSSLDPTVIANLTVSNVKGLMGMHLPDLKLFENDTVVQTWINLQLQSELDTLNLGLISNRMSPINPTPDSNGTTAVPGSNGTTAVPGSDGTTAVPGSDGTTAVPGSNGTTPVPGSNGTTAVPGSNGTTPVPGSDGTTAVPGSNGTTPVPDSDGTTAVPGSNGATAVPGSNGTTAVPGSNGTTPVPGSNGATAVPGSDGTTPVPGSKGTTAVPGSDGTTAVPGSNGTTPVPGSDGTTAVPGSDGATPVPGSDGTTAVPGSNGATAVPGSNGTTPVPGSNGATAVPGSNGTTPVPGSNGATPVPGSDGTTGVPGSNGTTAVPGSNGTTAVPGSDGTTAVPGSDGTTPVPGSDGTTAVPGSNGTTPVPGSDGTTAVPGSNGTTAVPGSKGTTAVPGSNGATPVTGSNGTTGLPVSNGTTAVPVSNGTTPVPGSNGATAVPGSDGTTPVPGSNGATAVPGSDGATPVPGSKGTTAVPGSDGTTAVPGSNGTTPVPGSDGTTAVPGSNGTTPVPGSDGTTAVPGSNGTTAVPGSNGATPVTGSNGTTGLPVSNGTTAVPVSNGATPVPGSNGTTAVPGSNGATPVPGSNGTTPVPGSDGTTGVPGSDGTTPVPGSNGATAVPGSNGTTPVPGSKGTAAVPGSDGTTAVPGSNGTTPVPGSDGTTAVPGSNGATPVPGSDGTTAVPGSNGATPVPGSDGTTAVPGSNGATAVPGSDGTTPVPGSNGATAVPGSDGTTPVPGSKGTTAVPGSDGTTAVPGSDGTTPVPGSDGTTAVPGSDGTTPVPGSDGTTAVPGSNGTTAVPGSKGTTAVPGSNGTTAVPGSNGTTAVPGSKGTTAVPGSNGTTPVPGSDGTTAVPGSNGTTPVPGSDGTTAVPGSNGTTAVPGSKGTTAVPGSNGATPVPGSNGTTGLPVSNGTTAVPVSNGTTPVPGSNGATAVPGSDGTTPVPGSKGTTAVPGSDGTTAVPGSNGTTPVPGSDGTTAVPGSNGTTPVPGSDGTTAVPGSNGTTAVPGSKGTTAVPGSNGASPVTGSNGTTGLPVSNGTTAVPVSNGATPVPGSNGTTAVPGSNGATPVPGSNGTTPVPGSDGTTPVPGSNGATAVPGSDGTTPVPGSKGTTAVPGSDGTTAVPGSNGTTPVPGSKGTTAVPGSNGATAVPGSNGTTPVPGSNGATAVPGSDGTTAVPGSNGATAVPGSNSTTSAPGSNGTTTGSPGSSSTTASQTNGKVEPGKSQTTIMLAALLTAMLQILLQPA
ncbi:guanine nucleotide-binding protein G(I)/G(S)/G(T) subunit beta-3 [Sarotherodon galilaeus]